MKILDINTRMKVLFIMCFLLSMSQTVYAQTDLMASNPSLKDESIPSKTVLKVQDRSRKGCLVKGDTLKKQIALTFDDGPTDLSKEVILLLNKYDAKATFFWLGKKLDQKKKTIKLAKKSGHLIANHSWDHQKGLELSKEAIWNIQVEITFKALKRHGVRKSKYYRPPYGAITQDQIDYLAEKGITTVLWSIALQDWVKSEKTEEKIFDKFKNQIHNGAIILLHDFDDDYSQDKLKAIERILIYGKSKGYQFVTIDNI